MKVQTEQFINELEEKETVSQEVIQEMWYLYKNPEQIESGMMRPNFDNMEANQAVMMYHFYAGMIFGIGMSRREDVL